MIAEILLSNFVLAILTPVLCFMVGVAAVGVAAVVSLHSYRAREEREGQRIVEEGAGER